MGRKKYRSVFISDVHIGSQFCRIDELIEFLRSIKTDKLYLVGDIFDGWKLKRSFYWPNKYNLAVREILSYSKKGTDIYYIAGNHDDFLRDFLPLSFGKINICDEIIHETIDGRKLLVMHGDRFDGFLKHWSLLYILGDYAYTLALYLNRFLSWVSFWKRNSYWSLSATLKKKVKQAVNYINNYEQLVVRCVEKSGCDGVVCGHIHSPAVKEVSGLQYYNCGDWIEHNSAIVEDYEGNLELIYPGRQ